MNNVECGTPPGKMYNELTRLTLGGPVNSLYILPGGVPHYFLNLH